MLTTICPNCKKDYRLADRHAGKRVRCPDCRTVFRVEGAQAGSSLRARLQRELHQLAAGRRAPGAEASEGSKLRVIERERSVPGRGRLLMVAVLFAFFACAGAGGVWVYLRNRAEGQVPAQVHAALAKAQRADMPGNEVDALVGWQTARRIMLMHRESPDSFRPELRKADERIRQLHQLIGRRRSGLAGAQKVLAEARAALEAGQVAEAKEKLETLLADLAEQGPSGAELEELRRAAQGLLADPRLATNAGPPDSGAPETAAAPAEQEPASPAESLQQRVEAVRRRSARGELDLVIDEPKDLQRWHGESWANPVILGLEKRTGVGRQFVVLRQRDGDTGKWVMSIDQPLDLRAYDALTVDVLVREPVTMSIALWTGSGSTIFESPRQTVGQGGTRSISFALKGRGFKSQATNWRFGTEIQDPANAIRLTFFIYSHSRNPIRIRNVRLVKNA